MKVTKEYKFYYAHRNQELDDKCQHIHGHDAKIFISFNVKRTGNISTLFNDFDKEIEPWLKKQFDHRFAIDKNDPLLPYLHKYEKDTGKTLGLNVLPFATSVENVTFYLFDYIKNVFGFDVELIRYQETRTSTVEYSKEDYFNDLESFLDSKPGFTLREENQKTLESNYLDKDGIFLSLYEYLGFAAGKDLGKIVFEEANKRSIPANRKVVVFPGGGQQDVNIYPLSFLESYFKK